ncbi:hypothetical protein ACEQ8H_004580 [Pleosporales sp. CAS-2024a]
MAPKSLLRYIFRHGPHGKSHDIPPCPPVEAVAPDDVAAHVQNRDSRPLPEKKHHGPESPLAHKLRSPYRPNSRASSDILQDIAEESSSDEFEERRSNEAPSCHYDAASIAETFRSALSDIDVQTFSTRDLILATLREAKSANHGHLDTINTTLMLLCAIGGFSPTVDILTSEMLEKREIYEEKMALLQDLEGAVEQMHFGDEDRVESGG